MIAETGERFSEFAPYVAAIDDRGIVVYSATLTQGGSGVFRNDGTLVEMVAGSASGAFHEVCSHPDADAAGSVCFYAEDETGTAALYGAHGGEVIALSDAAGPLGPTANAEGTIAFRAPLPTGGEGVFSSRAGNVATIADTDGDFGAFYGLPVVDGAGRVVFRADDRDGREGIYAHDGDRVGVVVDADARFSGLGLFPFANDAGTIVFCGELRAGGAGVFLASAGTIATLVDTNAGFESFRGALLSGTDALVFYATPTGGELGIYTGPDPERDCLLAIGAALFDSSVTDFALNPVSINGTGHLAIRVALENGRQLILRADPDHRAIGVSPPLLPPR